MDFTTLILMKTKFGIFTLLITEFVYFVYPPGFKGWGSPFSPTPKKGRKKTTLDPHRNKPPSPT